MEAENTFQNCCVLGKFLTCYGDSRYEVEGGKTPLADTTTPPAESSPGCGMCVRSSGQETSEPTQQQQQQSSQQQPPKSSISPANCVPTIMDVVSGCFHAL
ncbi:hypothetical protein TNIN_202251 [Trichonephila inaurata madagascariensis]|uniref:Uncharacterized protein n=1 Tax=Trichonephila inaurata madagascariensis TaxID=2747483 RepID=A0A8X6XGW5_9ARAC|nr:hypothetical protein TNIN_202251 [Trichonephila inaurata madagascariensis]